jgi:hypothetical protein
MEMGKIISKSDRTKKWKTKPSSQNVFCELQRHLAAWHGPRACSRVQHREIAASLHCFLTTERITSVRLRRGRWIWPTSSPPIEESHFPDQSRWGRFPDLRLWNRRVGREGGGGGQIRRRRRQGPLCGRVRSLKEGDLRRLVSCFRRCRRRRSIQVKEKVWPGGREGSKRTVFFFFVQRLNELLRNMGGGIARKFKGN